MAVAPGRAMARNATSGRVIRNFPLGEGAREKYGAPHYHVHRAHLHSILASAFGPASIRLGAKFTGFTQDAQGVTLELASGEKLRGDVLLGADGVHSVIRAGVIGPEQPRFSGLAAWRGLAPVERLKQFGIEKNLHSWWGARKHFVHYYVDGGRLMNWVGVVPAGSWTLESWSAKGDKREALAEFDGWHPIVRGIVEATDEPFKWALYDRDPSAGWTQGRVTLLGDAAHSMLPFMSQGAGQSIEDGCVLGLCLARHPEDPQAALAKYETLRFERTKRVQLGSRANGQTFHLTSPLGAAGAGPALPHRLPDRQERHPQEARLAVSVRLRRGGRRRFASKMKPPEGTRMKRRTLLRSLAALCAAFSFGAAQAQPGPSARSRWSCRSRRAAASTSPPA